MADLLIEAQKLYKDSLQELGEQRRQIQEDLSFSDPSNPQQWDEREKHARENDPGGRRPCLVLDQCNQYVANVVGQVEKSPPSLHAIPVGGGADKDAAEQIDGRFRHIEHASRAMQHYARAATSAARVGVGYLIVRPTIIDSALGWQEPRISSEPDALRVIYDPWSTETDGNDGTFAYLLCSYNPSVFKRKYPGKEARDFGDLDSKTTDERKSVLLAEQWYQESATREKIICIGEDGEEKSYNSDEYEEACQQSGQQIPVSRTIKEKYQRVMWRLMSGADILETLKTPGGEESPYPSESIGIIPMYGYVGFANNRMTYCGIPRRARAAQQAYNYHSSELMMPKGQLLIPHRALAGAGVKSLWDNSRTERRAYMPYNDIDEQGAINQPSVISFGDGLINHEEGAAQALRDIQASIGMYQANLGSQGNETSGIAIESRKQQGEASTSHFPSHMAASLGQLGKIVMEMDKVLTDDKRVQPIIGMDGSAGKITTDPRQQQAFQRLPNGGGVQINPGHGTYGVRVVIGASYSTQRTQTNAAFAEVMRGNPELAATVAPFWAQTLDFPGSDKFAQAMAAMAPGPVKAILQPEGGDDQANDPARMAAELDAVKQQLAEAIQHAKDAQNEANQFMAEAHDAQKAAVNKDQELKIKAYDVETNRMKVVGAGNAEQAQQIVKDLITTMMQHPEPLPGEAPLSGEGPGPEGTPQHEQGESPQMETQEPPEPPGPSPELLALMASHQQLADGHNKLTDAVGQLIDYTKKPRKNVAVRDKHGNITHTINSIDEGA